MIHDVGRQLSSLVSRVWYIQPVRLLHVQY